MSTTTITQFRTDFPEFTDPVAYTDAQVQFYLNLAETRLDQTRWLDLWSYGVELYTAHSLALSKMRAAGAAGGAPPGATTGVITSKSVAGVSKSMDVGIVTVGGAGVFNLTSYGSEYYGLVRLIGIGGVQVGADALSAAQDATTFGDNYGYGFPIV